MELALVRAAGLKVTVILRLAIIQKSENCKGLNNNTSILSLSCIFHSFKKAIKYLFAARIQVHVCAYLEITLMFSKYFKNYF